VQAGRARRGHYVTVCTDGPGQRYPAQKIHAVERHIGFADEGWHGVYDPDRDRDHGPDRDPDRDHGPDPDRDPDSDHDRDPDRDHDRDPDRDPDRDHDRDPDRDPDRDHDHDDLSYPARNSAPFICYLTCRGA
jgi:hypothetical protein